MKNYLARNEGQRYAIYISFLCLSQRLSATPLMMIPIRIRIRIPIPWSTTSDNGHIEHVVPPVFTFFYVFDFCIYLFGGGVRWFFGATCSLCFIFNLFYIARTAPKVVSGGNTYYRIGAARVFQVFI